MEEFKPTESQLSIYKSIKDMIVNVHGPEEHMKEIAIWVDENFVSKESYQVAQKTLIEQVEFTSSKVDKINELNALRDELKKRMSVEKLNSIADLKTVKNFLSIYEGEAMTHKEKAYLGGKINTVIDKIISEKLNNLSNELKFDSISGYDDGLPF